MYVARQSELGPFAIWLRRKQHERRLTTEQLATEAGVGLRLLQKYRSGEVEWPRGQNRVRLETVLGPAPEAPDPFDDPVAA